MRIDLRARRRALGALFASLLTVILPTAGGATTQLVQVNLEVSLGAPTELDSPCVVIVPESSDGVVVLDAGVGNGCIASYKLVHFPFGDFVDCIEPFDVLGGSDREEFCTVQAGPVLVAFWLMFENGSPACYGVRDFRAHSGDVLEFSYAAAPVPVEFDC